MLLGLGLPTLIAEVLSFLAFLYVMVKLPFGFPLISRIMEERRERVRAQLEAAERDQKAAEELRDKIEAELKKTREDARGILEEAEKAAREESRGIIDEARRQAEGVVKAAREEIQAEKETMMREVYAQVVELTLAVSRKVLAKELDDDAHRRLIQETVERMEKVQ